MNVPCKCFSFSPDQHQLSLKTFSVLYLENHTSFFFVVSLVYGEAQVYQSAQAFAGHIGKRYWTQWWISAWHISVRRFGDHEIKCTVQCLFRSAVMRDSRSCKFDECTDFWKIMNGNAKYISTCGQIWVEQFIQDHVSIITIIAQKFWKE